MTTCSIRVVVAIAAMVGADNVVVLMIMVVVLDQGRVVVAVVVVMVAVVGVVMVVVIVVVVVSWVGSASLSEPGPGLPTFWDLFLGSWGDHYRCLCLSYSLSPPHFIKTQVPQMRCLATPPCNRY